MVEVQWEDLDPKACGDASAVLLKNIHLVLQHPFSFTFLVPMLHYDIVVLHDHVHIYIYTYLYILYVCVYVYIYIHIHMYIYIYMYVCMYVWVHIYTVYICTCITTHSNWSNQRHHDDYHNHCPHLHVY